MRLDELRKLAAECPRMETQTDWHAERDLECIGIAGADAAFIAATNPAAVLQLIAVAEAAKLAANGVPGEGWLRTQELRGERMAALRAALSALEKQEQR